MNLLCFLIPLIVLAASALRGQTACTDSLPRDTTRIVVAIASRLSDEAAPDTTSLLIGQLVAEHFAPPVPLALPTWPGTLPVPASLGPETRLLIPSLGLSGDLIFRIDSKGNLKLESARATTDSPNLNAALVAALTAANQVGELTAVARTLRPRPDSIRLRIVWSQGPLPLTTPLFTARLVSLRANIPPRPLHLGQLVYPAAAVTREVEADFYVQYIIDETGRPDPRSFRVRTAEYREFVSAAFAAIQQSTFEPAQAGPCPVPVLVLQRAHFILRR